MSNKSLLNNYLYPTLIFIFLSVFLTILLWPYLWSDPINNFLNTFLELANYKHFGGSENLFLGKFVMSTNVPWNYIPVWIFVTTPIIYLFFLLVGVIKVFFINIFYKKIKKNKSAYIDLFFFLSAFFPILAVILLKSTLYNGWRHLYFIYPFLLLISLVGIEYLVKNIQSKNILNILKIIIIFTFLHTSYWMLKNHPHQYVYFNILAGKDIKNKFEMDYWGLSYKENLDYLLSVDKRKKISVWNSSKMEMFYALLCLTKNERSRIVIVKELKNKNEADYWITNYYNDKNNYSKEFYNKYFLINDIVVDGKSINTIFKKK